MTPAPATARAAARAVDALATLVNAAGVPNPAISVEQCHTILASVASFLAVDDANMQAAASKFVGELAKVQLLEDAVADDRDARVESLSQLLRSKHQRVRANAAQCVANLALHPEYTQVLGRSTTVGPLLRLVAPASDLDVRQHAGRAIANLAANRELAHYAA